MCDNGCMWHGSYHADTHTYMHTSTQTHPPLHNNNSMADLLGERERRDSQPVIPLPDTVVEPLAVVVKARNTLVAESTMLGPYPSVWNGRRRRRRRH